MAIEMKKTPTLMNKYLYSGFPILNRSKVVMNGFWYDYLKKEYREKAKPCYMDTDSFIVYKKLDNNW